MAPSYTLVWKFFNNGHDYQVYVHKTIVYPGGIIVELILIVLLFFGMSFLWEKFKQGGGEAKKSTMRLPDEAEYHASTQSIEVDCPHCQSRLHIEEEGNWKCYNCQNGFVYFKNTTYTSEGIHSIFAIYIVSILSKYCKLDGVVTKDELAIVEDNIYSYIEATEEQMKGLKRIFNMEMRHVDDYEIVLNKLSNLMGENPESKKDIGLFLLETMFQIGTVDDHQKDIHLKHQEVIFKVMGIFHINMELYESLKEKYMKVKDDSYAILQCKRNATENEVRRKYRELSKKYHPDVLASKDLSPEIVDLAADQFKKINEAYRSIMQHFESEKGS